MLLSLQRRSVRHSGYSLRELPSCTILTGDSTISATYSGFEGRLADVMITDPPYCLLHRRRKGGDLRDPKKIIRKLDNDDAVRRFNDLAEYTTFTKSWMRACHGSLKPQADLIIWSNALGKQPIQRCCNELGYAMIGEYLWAKHTKNVEPGALRSEVLLRVYESALIFRHRSKEAVQRSRAIPWSVVTGYHDECASSAHPHPCRKPVIAIEPLVLSWSRPDDLVLDPFVGSGGIVEACLSSGRSVIGVEILPQWSKYTIDTASTSCEHPRYEP